MIDKLNDKEPNSTTNITNDSRIKYICKEIRDIKSKINEIIDYLAIPKNDQ